MNCSKESYPSNQELSKIIFNSNKPLNFQVLKRQDINFITNKDRQILYIIRKENFEGIYIIHLPLFSYNKWNLIFKKEFYLVNFGPYFYDENQKNWNSSRNEGVGYVIKKYDHEGTLQREKIFLEVLTEDPIQGLISFPLIFGYEGKFLDGLTNSLDKFWKRSYINYYNNSLNLVSFGKNGKLMTPLYFNGMEYVPENYYIGISRTNQPNSDLWTFRIYFKNNDKNKKIDFIISFPNSNKVYLKTKLKLSKLYKPGYLIQNNKKNKWYTFVFQHKDINQIQDSEIEFSYSPTTGVPVHEIFFSVQIHEKNKLINYPNKFSANKTRIDQFGGKSYFNEFRIEN